MSISNSSEVMRLEGLVSGPAGEDIVILNLQGNNYIALDAVGRRIWELLVTPRRVEELCAQLEGEYSAPPGKVAADVLHFLEELNREGMLRVVE